MKRFYFLRMMHLVLLRACDQQQQQHQQQQQQHQQQQQEQQQNQQQSLHRKVHKRHILTVVSLLQVTRSGAVG